MQNQNIVAMTGNLTRDPELRSLPSGMSVCSLRIANNTRRKDASGQWGDKANYFNVTVWGGQGENCAKFLSKGSPIALDGRLEWREWQTQEGQKREAVEIVANSVQFLSSGGERQQRAPTSDVPDDFGGGGTGYGSFAPAPTPTPAQGSLTGSPGADPDDDDIPF